MNKLLNKLRRRKYLILLLTLILIVVVYPLLRSSVEGNLLFDIALTLVFLGVLQVFFARRTQRFLAMLLGVPTIAGVWLGYIMPAMPPGPVAVAFHASAAFFLSFTIVFILRSIYREETISSDGVYGAFAGYLLLGLTFGNFYCLAEYGEPGSFQGEGLGKNQAIDDDHRHFLLTYFSFATLTTVGYGDLYPAKDGAKGLAIAEAIMGQFYIAVLIGELIGKKVSQALSGRS